MGGRWLYPLPAASHLRSLQEKRKADDKKFEMCLASKSRHLKRGVKEVVKSLRKGEKGIVVLAADISPLDILTHLPLLAEESACPYIVRPLPFPLPFPE